MKRAKSQQDKKTAIKTPVAIKPTPTPSKAPRFAHIAQAVELLIFFCVFCVFVVCYIDPQVLLSSSGIDIHHYVSVIHAQKASPESGVSYDGPPLRRLFILELTPRYFLQAVSEPGGLMRLIVTLSLYACHYPLIGALLITAAAVLFRWVFFRFLSGVCAVRSYSLGFIPPLFLVIVCAWYEWRYFAYLFPIAGSLGFAVLYQKSGLVSHWKRVIIVSALFWSAWYCMQWGCFLVLLFIVIHELFQKKRTSTFPIMAAVVVNAATAFVLDAFVIPLRASIHWRDFTESSCLPLAVIVFFPIAAVLFAALSRMKFFIKIFSTWAGVIAQTAIAVFGVSAVFLWVCLSPVNRDTRTIARTEHHCIRGNWAAVLREPTRPLFAHFGPKPGSLQALMMHSIDHALCSSGTLGDSVFNFPQVRFCDDPLLLLETTLTNGYVNWIAVMDLAMDLGLLNTAERTAGEIMENMGPFPDILYRRALVQLAKGNKEAAGVYLRKLSTMPFFRSEARGLLDSIDNEAFIARQPRIALMRANCDTVDYFLYTVSYETVFKKLLQSNPRNKAAFDYLMTYYLLVGRLDVASELARRAPEFGYSDLPRAWEEAMCVYLAANMGQPGFKAPFTAIRSDIVARFNDFAQSCMRFTQDSDAAEKLSGSFGDTYFYFSIFGRTNPCKGTYHE